MASRRLDVAGAAVLAAGVALAFAGGLSAAAAGGSSPRELTAAIKRTMRRKSIPGAIIGVWQRGRAPYVRAFGVRDKATGQPMTTNLRMRIGSVTKTFLVTALLEREPQRTG